MMCAADRMVVLRMRVPVQTPTPVDVAIVRPPVDADAGKNRHQDPCIENAGVEPIPGAAGVHPRPWKETRKQGHQATPSVRCEVVLRAVGSLQSDSNGGEGPNVVMTTSTIAPRPAPRLGGVRDPLRISRTSPPSWDRADGVLRRKRGDCHFAKHVLAERRYAAA